MQVKIGTYTGNGVDNRAITGIGFQPDLVIIKGDSTVKAVFKLANMTGGNSLFFYGDVARTGHISTLDTDGFTVRTSDSVNTNNITYYYIAIKKETNDPDFNYGVYTGNGTDDRNITGVGFQPTLVVIKISNSTGNEAVSFDNNDNDNTGAHIFPTTGTMVFKNTIQALQSDGFQIGSNVRVNDGAGIYYWFAFRAVTGRINTGTYTGNATDDRNITGVGFQPDWVWVANWDTTTTPADDIVFRTKSFSGDGSLGFQQSRAITANIIQSILSDGFQIGTHNNVNINNDPYHWFALAETTTSTSTSTSSSTSTSTSTSTTTSTSSSTSTSTTSTSSSTTSTSSSTTTSTSTTTTLTSTSTSSTSSSTSTTSTSTSTTSTSTSTTTSTSSSSSSSTSLTTSTSSSTSTTSTSTSTTTTFPFHIRAEATPQGRV